MESYTPNFINQELQWNLFDLEEKLNEAQKLFTTEWQPLRKKTINKLEEIAEAIQAEEERYRIGSIVYSSADIIAAGLGIGGIVAFPFTFGLSLGLSAAGIGTALASGAASFTHGVIKTKNVTGHCQTAIEICKTDNEVTEKLFIYLDDLDQGSVFILNDETFFTTKNVVSLISMAMKSFDLKKHLKSVEILRKTGKWEKALKPLLLSKTAKKILPKFAKESIAGGAKLASRVTIPLAAVGILRDIISITSNARKIIKEELCSKAKEILKLKERLQKQEDEIYKRLFY